MVILVLSAPLAFLFLSALNIVAEGDFFTDNEKNFITELFLLAYAFNFVGLYLVRLIAMAVKVLSARKKPEKK